MIYAALFDVTASRSTAQSQLRHSLDGYGPDEEAVPQHRANRPRQGPGALWWSAREHPDERAESADIRQPKKRGPSTTSEPIIRFQPGINSEDDTGFNLENCFAQLLAKQQWCRETIFAPPGIDFLNLLLRFFGEP